MYVWECRVIDRSVRGEGLWTGLSGVRGYIQG